jgi:capsular polysaccharide biosynthesis protein
LYFEELDFKEQIQYFNNAKIIICAHGAVLSNMFFCKKNTKIIEITCNKKWIFFDNLSSILSLNHIKIHNNNFNSIKIVLDKLKITT